MRVEVWAAVPRDRVRVCEPVTVLVAVLLELIAERVAVFDGVDAGDRVRDCVQVGVDERDDVGGGKHTVVSDVGAGPRPEMTSWLILKPVSIKSNTNVTLRDASRKKTCVGVTTSEMVFGVPAVATICAGVKANPEPQTAPRRLLTTGL